MRGDEDFDGFPLAVIHIHTMIVMWCCSGFYKQVSSEVIDFVILTQLLLLLAVAFAAPLGPPHIARVVLRDGDELFARIAEKRAKYLVSMPPQHLHALRAAAQAAGATRTTVLARFIWRRCSVAGIS